MKISIRLPKLSAIKVKKLVLMLVFAGGFYAAGYITANDQNPLAPQRQPKVTIGREVPAATDIDFALFWEVWDTVNSSFFDKSKIIPSNLVYGAIKGMVAAVGDPYTVFLTPEENKITGADLDGNFEGVGIQIGFKGRQLAVISPLPGSPAESVGVKAGDFIVGIKDEAKNVDRSTNGMSLAEAVSIIRGPAGTKVTLALVRDGVDKPIIVDVERNTINVPSVKLEYIGDNKDVAHIQILKFGGETKNEWDNTVREVLKNSDTKGIVLDLRNDPGGYMQAAVDIASDFLAVGQVVVREEHSDGRKIDFKVERNGFLTKMPLVVMVNEGSASASEILAGALRDQKKTLLIGENSFGKGTVQERQELSDGVALHVTSARWLTPNGTWVNEVGLAPDTEVKDNAETEIDEQLEAALQAL